MTIRSTLPILTWLPAYRRRWLRLDLIAGLTLAAYAVPVAVAYASLAGLPPQAGLYCYLAGGITYAVFGSSRQLAIGPTSAISILIGSAVGVLAPGDLRYQAHLAAAASVLAGIMGIVAWALRLGNIANFISETVLSGFKVGAGLVIASTQIPKIFGVSAGGNNFFSRVLELIRHLPETNLATLAVGFGAFVLIVAGEKLFPGRPVALVVVVLSIVGTLYFPLAAHGVKAVGIIPQGLPRLSWPVIRWHEVDDLLGLGLACFLLSYTESISVARTYALKHEYRVSAGQELLALGMVNLATGVAQGYPSAGGMSQSAVNEKAGAQTPMAIVFASAGLALVLLFLTSFMRGLPQAVLAAVVMAAVGGLIKTTELRHLYRASKTEFSVAMTAAIGVLAFGILKGVLLAATFSILLVLRSASRPRIAVLGQLPQTKSFADMARHPEARAVPGVLVLRVEAGLFYFNAQYVYSTIVERLGRHETVEQLILDLSTSPNIDLSGARMLGELEGHMARERTALAFAEVHGAARDLLRSEARTQQVRGVARRTSIAALIEKGHDGAAGRRVA